MGTLKTTIILQDKFSDQLNKINKSIQNTANNMNRLNNSNATSVKNVNNALSQQIAQNNTILKQMGQWATKLRNILTIFYAVRGAAQTVGAAVRMSDKMTMADARLNLVTGGDKKLKGELEEKSFAAAQRSTTDYLEFTKAVGKLGILAGDKFKNNDSIVRFVELMNKSFQISGAETSERNAAMLQITQAIASNRLQGDEFRSILENAPMVMDALNRSLGVGQAELKAMAKEGKITADVLIKAMFDAGTKIETMYKELPMTWERHWAKLKNVYTMAFKPINEQLTRLFNSGKFQAAINGIGNALIVLGNSAGWALKTTLDLLDKITNMFERCSFLVTTLKGVFAGLGVAFAVFLTAQLIGLAQSAIAWFIARKEAFLYQLALFKMAVAQHGLNAAIAMCPITWLLYAIIAVITVVYLAVAAFNHFAGTSISATGAIAGAVAFLGTLIWDVIVGVLSALLDYIDMWVNVFIKAAEVIYNTWTNGWTGWINGVKSVFGEFVSWVLGKIKPLVELWDKFKGTNYAATLTATQEKFSNLGGGSSYKKFNTVDMGGWLRDKAVNPVTAFKNGYKWGANLENSIGNLTKVTLNGQQLTAEALNGIDGKLGDVGANTGDTAKNTKDTASNTSSTEDYSYLRNWAYQSGLGNSIGYNIKIEQNNKNNIGSNMDLNRVVDAVRDAIIEGITVQAEGVRG